MSVKRILFVDDQSSEADNLESIIKSLGDDWESEIVSNGTHALEVLQRSACDVIVTEMKLPDMSGVDLLKKAIEHCPGSVRFVLSGDSDRGQILQGSGSIHQFIAKPYPPAKFKAVLNSSLSLRQLLSNDTLQARIASISSLPSPPEVYNSLVKELQSETASIQKIADLIRQDISITAKLLQIVNSAFFGLSSTVNNPLQAVNILGLETVKSLVMAAGIFNQFDDSKSSEFSINSIFNHSVAVGASARLFATALGLETKATEDSLLGGMLHDVGKLVMFTYFYTELDNAAKLARENSIPLHEAEKQIMGVTDAEIGAYLLSLWGIPDAILEAVALHYLPHKSTNPILDVLTCVHLAYAFNLDQDNDNTDPSLSALDLDYLQNLGIGDQVEDLRNLCMGAVT